MASFIHGHILSEKIDALNITPIQPPYKEGILISKLTVSGIVNFLSIIGACLIIVSYLFFKSVRTKGRLVLLHISLADLGISLSNFVGAVFFFNRHKDESHCSLYDSSNWSESCHVLNGLCKTQAFFAAYCTLASFFWTPTLAVYVYLLITDPSRTLSTYLVRFAYMFCWGLPLLISLWLMFTDRLGDTGFGGWCSLIVETADGSISTFVVIFASNLYVVTTFVVVLVLYTATHCYLRLRMEEVRRMYNSQSIEEMQPSDQKFLFIPVAFLLLRLGSLTFSVLYIYTNIWDKMSTAWRLVVQLYMIIGDSGQGLVNGILFCIFTPRVREKFCSWLPCPHSSCHMFRRRQRLDSSIIYDESMEEKKLLDKIYTSYSTQSTVCTIPPSVAIINDDVSDCGSSPYSSSD